MDMKRGLLPEEHITAVQEQLIGFLNSQVISKDGEFHYDGGMIARESESEDSERDQRKK